VKPEASLCCILEVVLEAVGDATKGDFAPRNVIRLQQGNLEAFIPGRVPRCSKAAAIEEMNLIDVRDADHRKWRVNNDPGASFLIRFTTSGLGSGFTVFHEAGGHRPEPASRFDGSAAKQDAPLPDCNAAHDQPRVLIMNVTTTAADVPGERVASGNLERDASAAVSAKLDHRMRAFGIVRAV